MTRASTHQGAKTPTSRGAKNPRAKHTGSSKAHSTNQHFDDSRSGNVHAESPRAKKSLGQHFLRRPDICTRIAALALPGSDDRILEIGPGPGALTKALLAQPHARLLLLEKDHHWAAEQQRTAAPTTQTVLMDALRFDWTRITPDQPWKIVGNLPYNVASPLIWDIVSRAAGLTRAVFMVQKEVGQRMAAAPDSSDYGALSIWVQSFTRPRLEFIVGPGAFNPPPRVDSAVLSFEPLPAALRPQHPELLSRLLKACFQLRRKQLSGIFRRSGLAFLEEHAPEVGFSLSARPETLNTTQFLQLSSFWAAQLDKV